MEYGNERSGKGIEQEKQTQVSQQGEQEGRDAPGAGVSMCKGREAGTYEMTFVIAHIYRVFIVCHALLTALQLLT